MYEITDDDMIADGIDEARAARRRTDEPWKCDNCETVWAHKPDTWPCAYLDCETEVCNEKGCKAECSLCDRVFCREHLMMLRSPDGPLCAACFLADFPDLGIGIVAEEIVELLK